MEQEPVERVGLWSVWYVERNPGLLPQRMCVKNSDLLVMLVRVKFYEKMVESGSACLGEGAIKLNGNMRG